MVTTINVQNDTHHYAGPSVVAGHKTHYDMILRCTNPLLKTKNHATQLVKICNVRPNVTCIIVSRQWLNMVSDRVNVASSHVYLPMSDIDQPSREYVFQIPSIKYTLTPACILALRIITCRSALVGI